MDLLMLNALLARRPEMVIGFPPWLFGADLEEQLRAERDLAVAEIAGRDSIAAVLAAVEEHAIGALLPTIAYTGTEFGDWSVPISKSRRLASRLKQKGTRVYPPLVLGSPQFWRLLCGRPMAHVLSRFRIATPCLACHLYLHALRIPLAKRLAAGHIISGERESHDGRIKLNQVSPALDAYTAFVQSFGLTLAMPLRHVERSQEILEILGEDWEEGQEQVECVLSANYRDLDGAVDFDGEAIRRYFSEFAVPVAQRVVQTYLEGHPPDLGTDLLRGFE